MMNKPNPDDRSDNVEKLQTAIENTRENIKEANEATQFSSEADNAAIQAKNERRLSSIAGMEAEIADEQQARKNGFQNEDGLS